jgi:hypothetical protein
MDAAEAVPKLPAGAASCAGASVSDDRRAVDVRAYRALAIAVCRSALRGDRRRALAFVRSDRGRLWLSWLRLDARALESRLEQTPPGTR